MLWMLVSVASFAAPPPLDAEVVRQLSPGSTPKSFGAAMDWVAADPARAHALVRVLSDPRVDRWIACNALERSVVEEAGPALRPLLDSPEDLVRSACTRAYAEWAVRFHGDLAPLAARLADPECTIRRSAAGGLGADLTWARTFRTRFATASSSCDRQVALAGLTRASADRAEAGALLLLVFVDAEEDQEVREVAGMALASLEYPPAEASYARMMFGPDPGGNLRMWAIRGLEEIGTRASLEALDAAIAADPYDGEGVWAIEGKRARAAILARANAPAR